MLTEEYAFEALETICGECVSVWAGTEVRCGWFSAAEPG